MNGPLQVSTSEMSAHSDNIAGISGQMGVAAATAETTSAEQVASAFGALFAPFVVPLLAGVESAAKGFINAAQGTTASQVQAVTDLAETFTATDEAGGQRLDQAVDGSHTLEYPGVQA